MTRVSLVAAIGLLAAIFVTSQGGCAHTQQGLAREAAVYSVAPNAVAGAATVSATVPTPWQPLADAAIAVLGAALAAWNTSHARRLRSLETASPPVPVPSPAAPKAS